ncbi:desmocollin 2-like protein [Erpetoichthys calabaricus]|uniref:desmocollin 2-like protein n=1 Tax=Erpetoichthys calabaricus TaxID=27687 RepID=UPI002234D7D0|nr:desmocollin 2-like protein [Erpetoichthys calabaricus]
MDGRVYRRYKMAYWNYFCWGVSLMVMTISAEACVFNTLKVTVPEELKPGYVIHNVDFKSCLKNSDFSLQLSDPNFAVQPSGLLYVNTMTNIPSEGKNLTITVQNEETNMKSDIYVVLLAEDHKVQKRALLKRVKRKWRPLPFSVKENALPPFPQEVQQIQSDASQSYTIIYKIYGMGVDKPPVDLFSVIPETGMIRIHRSVDREEIPQYRFWGQALTRDGQIRDSVLDIIVNVEDDNDNTPVIPAGLVIYVPEHSPSGTVVGQVKGTDRDEENTLHTKLKYRIVSENNKLFYIHPETGVVTTMSNALDREVNDAYELLIEVRDMNGEIYGRSSTGSVTVKLTDINDNPPVFKSQSYKTSIEENKSNILILRIPVEDKDLKNTSNWKAKFVIKKGNETGNFYIKTDPVTNEGLLYVIKPLDYEKTSKIDLEITAENEAKLVGTGTWFSVPVTVNVIDVDEGPEFEVPVMKFRIKENEPNGTLIGTYRAFDPESKSANGMKYYKISDPASWINVEQSSGAIKVANTMDRESSFVMNDQYNITVKAVDQSLKSGTGTVVIEIEDVNDNVPRFTLKDFSICQEEGQLGYTDINAQDLDAVPNSAPFVFEIPDNKDGNWKIINVKETSAQLAQAKPLPNGIYNVPVLIRDQQGNGITDTVTVRICKCLDSACVEQQNSIGFGTWGILAMLLGLALFLLLCILLNCLCNKKTEKAPIDGGAEAVLLKSNTEGPGEEVMAPNMKIHGLVPVEDDNLLQSANHSALKTSNFAMSGGENHLKRDSFIRGDTLNRGENGTYGNTMRHFMRVVNNGTLQSNDFYGESGAQHYTNSLEGNTLWLTNRIYLDKKREYFARECDNRFAEDIIHSYEDEGNGSVTSGIGCCSQLNDDSGLEFLNKLEPKFRTLAEICSKK